jgi:hypothetical protein
MALGDLASPKRGHTFWGLMGTLTVCIVLIWLRHGHWLQHPNDVIIGEAPDGFKSYTNAAWHVRHDTTMLHFSGMNYPFGEHVLFTDNQPLLANAMQWWHMHISDLTERTTGIINIFQAISIGLCCMFLFLLFRKLHFAVWYAGAVAIAMTFLAPQFQRFDGHYGLSHTFIIPWLLLLLCRYEERNSRRYQSLLIGLLVFFSAQLHFYYFGLSALLLTLYVGYQAVRYFSWSNLRARFSHWAVMVLLPYALLTLWLQLSDYAIDRPSNPYGFTHYIGRWEGIFLPPPGFPLHRWISENAIPIRSMDSEAQAYAGILALPFTLWMLAVGFRIFPRDWNVAAHHRVRRRFLRAIMASGLTLTIFCCGFPYAIPGLQWMVDYMGPFRQFRGLGRFTWLYFYIINILLFYIAWNVGRRFKGFQNGRAAWLKWPILWAPVLVLALEAWVFQRVKTLDIYPNAAKRALAAPTPDHWLNKVDFTPYQALLPLPYYHVGSEKFWLELSDNPHFKHVQTTALHTGVPDLGVNMSRTPASQTLRSVQLALEPGEMPALLNDLRDNRPLALLVNPRQRETVERDHSWLLRNARLVYKHPDLEIFSLSPDSLPTAIAAHRAALRQQVTAATPFRRGAWSGSSAELPFVHQTFDSLPPAPGQAVFQGKGSLQGQTNDTTFLWRSHLTNGVHVVSLWIYARPDLPVNHRLYIRQEMADGQVITRDITLSQRARSLVRGWMLSEIPFDVVGDTGATVTFFLYNKGERRTFTIDEFQCRPAELTLFRTTPTGFVVGNRWYE